MPPFSDEPAEKTSKPLSFLNLSHARTSVTTRRRAPGIFGDEPAEPVDSDIGRGVAKPVGKRSLDDEDCGGSKKPAAYSKSTSSHATLFGDEGSEDDADPPKTNMVMRAFADEASEGGTSSQSSDEEKFKVKQDTVFAFGWGSVAMFKKATVWRENMDDPQASKPKRNYDNSKRAKDAQYMRRKTRGHYKRNGLDPTRLQKLFDANTCLCPFVGYGVFWSFFFLLRIYIYIYVSSMKNHVISSWMSSPTWGGKKKCFKQFNGSKELRTFLEQFWNISKQDQDSIAPCQSHVLFKQFPMFRIKRW